MPTLYCDLENGNDNYAGTSFAVLAQGTNGRTSGTTFSSAGASFPNDGSLIGQYLSIFNGTLYIVHKIVAWVSATSLTIESIGSSLADITVDRQYYIGGRWKTLTSGATNLRTTPGDTVRIMGSPAPTSLGQTAVWTSQALQATQFAPVSAAGTTPISMTLTGHGYSTGDTVVITNHLGNTNANGTWEITVTGPNTFTLDGSTATGPGGTSGTVRLRNNTRVMLTTAVTQNIASTGPGRAAWVASANVTASVTTTAQKEGATADIISILAAFTTGKAAYWTLPSATNLSGYQQVSFWIRSDLIGTIAAGVHELRLCSDTTGDVAVNTISIPAMSGAARWMPFTVDLGSNLGTNIQSIALYVVTDTGAQTLLLNNIIACKASSAADSLTLTSLIGKNTTGETFWGIQSINGRRVMLDADTNAQPTSTSVRGYYGTSETVTTWKRETIKLGPAASSTTALQTIQDSGTDGNPITFSGGWDRTNMSTQSLETWLDGVNGNGYGIFASAKQYLTLTNISVSRFLNGVYLDNSQFVDMSINSVTNNSGTAGSGAVFCPGHRIFVTVGHGIANFGPPVTKAGASISSNGSLTINHALASNGSHGLDAGAQSIVADFNSVKKGTGLGLIANNGGGAIRILQGNLMIKSIATADNISFSILPNQNGSGSVLIDCLINDASEVNATNGEVYYSHNHDQVAGNHKVFMSGALVSSANDQRNTASGISWKILPTSTSRSSSWPVSLSLAKVACSANNLVTIKAWMRRDNSGLTMRLVCKGGQIAGVPNDVTSSLTTTNAWEEETITFTPTEAGVVEITAEAWGGTTFSGWVDDMTITQA